MNPEPDRQIVRKIHDDLPTFPRKNLNPSQRYAVSMSLASTGFTLIQGPPGCGKTRTIEELLCAILAGFAKNGTSETNPKVLCCAPSNAAIDEVAVRVMARMQSNFGLLRIGSYNYAEKGDSKAKEIHIDTLIPYYYEKKKYKQGQNLAKRSDIIFTTLSSAGLQVLNDIAFDFIVVDESTQSVEPSTLIPLRFKAKAYVLVGDPQQLPATVISNVDQYKCSLFERFMKNGVKPCLLDVQYRMHEEIRKFPSLTFYDDKLQDGQIYLSVKIWQFTSLKISGLGRISFSTVCMERSRNHIVTLPPWKMWKKRFWLLELFTFLRNTSLSKPQVLCQAQKSLYAPHTEVRLDV